MTTNYLRPQIGATLRKLSCSVAVGASVLCGTARVSAATFDYEPTVQTHLVSQRSSNGVLYRTIRFGPAPRQMLAELVAPEAIQPKVGPGILFVHWEGDRKTTNHTEFEADAALLAKRGVTSVLLDAHWSTFLTQGHIWFTDIRKFETDDSEGIAQVIELRRALDLLLSQPGVDASRIAYVGHDFGAMYGAILAGVDKRAQYFVFLAAVPSLGHWMMFYKTPPDVNAYLQRMEVLESAPYLASSKAKGFLFQFADTDHYITPGDRRIFFEEAPAPRAMYIYRADHALKVTEAFNDRIEWLTTRLSIARPAMR